MQCLSLRSGAIAVCHGICLAAYFRSDSSCAFLLAASIPKPLVSLIANAQGLRQPGIFYYLQSKKIPRFTNRFTALTSSFNLQIKIHTLSSYMLACALPGCVTIFASQCPRLFSCSLKNLHCVTWDIYPI